MSLEPKQQFKKFLEQSKEILILIPENPSGDAIGSAWALYFFLKKRNINPAIASANQPSPKFDFLPKPENFLTEISGARDFVLSFDTVRNKIMQIRTEEKDSKFNIYLTPEKGSIDPRDFSFILAKFKYDLIIVLDSPDLEKLGRIYENNSDLFFEVPIVNIDRRSNNENFGQINLIDVTASSCSEIVGNLLEEIDSDLIDNRMADCLLTGTISATDSFQKKNTTPRTLLFAATLMDKGGNQQEIVRWLYKTHPLHILKLLGRAMAKLNWDQESKLIRTEITLEDFIQSRSTPVDALTILEKIQESYCEAKIFMAVFSDRPDSSIALIKTVNHEAISALQSVLGGEIKRDFLEISIPGNNLSETSSLISDKIKTLTE